MVRWRWALATCTARRRRERDGVRPCSNEVIMVAIQLARVLASTTRREHNMREKKRRWSVQSWPWQLGVRRSFGEIAAVETIKCTLTSTRMGLQMVWGGRTAHGKALCTSDWKMARRQRCYIAAKLTVAKASSSLPWQEREREWEQRGEPKQNEGSNTSWQSWSLL
jgi:hypothetical protein